MRDGLRVNRNLLAEDSREVVGKLLPLQCHHYRRPSRHVPRRTERTVYRALGRSKGQTEDGVPLRVSRDDGSGHNVVRLPRADIRKATSVESLLRRRAIVVNKESQRLEGSIGRKLFQRHREAFALRHGESAQEVGLTPLGHAKGVNGARNHRRRIPRHRQAFVSAVAQGSEEKELNLVTLSKTGQLSEEIDRLRLRTIDARRGHLTAVLRQTLSPGLLRLGVREGVDARTLRLCHCEPTTEKQEHHQPFTQKRLHLLPPALCSPIRRDNPQSLRTGLPG